jgi:AcrR family transcriptional regulator
MSGGGRTTKSERTKKAILDAAEELFSTLGYEGASLDAIGERAGVQGTAILYHFPSKRVLYAATLERIFSPLLRELNEMLRRPQAVAVRLEAAVDAIVLYAAGHPNAPRLLLREAVSPGADAREIIEEQAASNAAGVMAAFATLSGDPGVDPVMVMNIIVGAICFYFVSPPGFVGQGPYDPHDPRLVSAFGATMRELARSLLHLDWQQADHVS